MAGCDAIVRYLIGAYKSVARLCSRNRHAKTAVLATMIVSVLSLFALAGPAFALKAISVSPDQDRIEVTSLGELSDNRGDSLQIETAADAGIVAGRMTVRASVNGSNPTWLAFALHNPTDKPIERWLTAERYTMFGSGAVWPDLDARRIEALTPSLGFVPERIRSDRADIFRITIEPGQTITYVAEFAGQRFNRVYLWKPLDYEFKARDRQLFNGVLLGLTGLLAIFLTAVIAANHKAIFPTAALVAWCVLAHLTVDFGFFHKLFQLKADDYAVYRAATEAAVAASLLVFLNTFLRMARAPSLIRMLLGVWVAGQIALVAVAVIDPRLASTFARVSFMAVGGIGALTIGMLALRGEDRALALVPTWLLLLIWVLAAGMILTGRLSTEIAASGVTAGLVLIVVLIGFTVTQFAFRSLEPAYTSGLGSNEQQISALAVEASGAGLFEWLVSRNEVKLSPMVDNVLGLAAGTLSNKLPEFLKYVHEADRQRVRLAFSAVQTKQGAALSSEFRLRHADNSTRWFEIEAAGVPGADPRSNRFVGLVRDITEVKRAHERLIHDAVYCSLTGIPNRALFLDRLANAMERARSDERLRPSVMIIDLDRFKSINAQHGMPIGDSLLLTITRRLQHHVARKDMLARLAGDKFAILFEDERNPQDFAREAEHIRRSIRAPIRIDGQDIVVTGSLGIAFFDGSEARQLDLLDAAEIAVARAKQTGVDRIEIFQTDMRGMPAPSANLAAFLERALEKGQIKVLYQPIIYLPTQELAGFEASIRVEHAEQGLIDPTQIDMPTSNDIVSRIWSQSLNRAAKDAARWQTELPRSERPLFVSFNVATKALFRPELGREVRRILDHGVLPKGSLRLEISESIVMENPEQASEILHIIDGVGAELTLDGFGAGYTNLAYLSQMPFDMVKLDRDLVQAAEGGETAAAPAVRSLVALSLELGKKVVADGVEDPEAVAFLRGIGCVFAQGFYYGDPMPDREVMQLLKLVRKAEHSMQPGSLFRRTARKPKRTSVDQPVTVAAVAAAAAKDSSRGRLKRRGKSKEVGRPTSPASLSPTQTMQPGSRESEPSFGSPAFPLTIDDHPHTSAPNFDGNYDPSQHQMPPGYPTHPAHIPQPVGDVYNDPYAEPFVPDALTFNRGANDQDRYVGSRTATALDTDLEALFRTSVTQPVTPSSVPVAADPIAMLGAALKSNRNGFASTVTNGNGRANGTSHGNGPGHSNRDGHSNGNGAGHAPGNGMRQMIAHPSSDNGNAAALTAVPPTLPHVRAPKPPADLSKLPPGLAASLAKLANTNTLQPAVLTETQRPSSIPSLSAVQPDKREAN